MSHQTPILVAPRPVRFFTRSDDLKLSFNDPALEEFLSILKPSLLATTLTKRSLTSAEPICGNPPQFRDLSFQSQESPRELISDSLDVHLDKDQSRNWLSTALLSSPVCRMHTRNPFLRRLDNAPSPASVPLPTPTPSEDQNL